MPLLSFIDSERGAERPPKGSPFRVPSSPLAERWHPALTAQRRVPHERSEWGTISVIDPNIYSGT
jgi:hypothetical protein